jgi:peroxiredoxin
MTARGQLGTVLVIVMFVAVAVMGGRRAVGKELQPIGTGERAPNFAAQTLDVPTRTKTLADYKGDVVLLNVWATWCEPCRAEMPGIEQLYQSYGPRGLKVVAVSIDEARMEGGIRAFAKELGLTFEILHDSAGAIQQIYQMTGVPESFLIGRDGVIRKKIAGAVDWNTESDRRLIAHLLGER